ncbi:short-chain dehydrogenase/reductase superfamily [Polychytrium aggregatum]|uniref:short-chain dehydrogenase/reductase superfamily n=1 Tax=Polychytrium aggregatum TaxID=110093 RepID=UPI0022FF1B1A|nr:short-chain dehydrogenase/reductase superfamily [Polychytrium aggregatum]KAI9199309.1 short-chain dehydrogenase/reductase superfamily [Polychytrium aggregatum]
MSIVAITGASRGIGLEFLRQLIASDEATKVIALVRNPDDAAQLQEEIKRHPGRVLAVKLDVTNEESVKSAAKEVEKLSPEGIDILINNAGAYLEPKGSSPINTSAKDILASYATNTIGPFLTIQNFFPQLLKRQKRTVVNITSAMGSIAWSKPNSIAYRSSKAALNSVVSILAQELGPQGATLVLFHPGWVQTDMGGSNADLTVSTSVSSILKVVHGLKHEDNGKFFNYDGTTIPW